MKQIVTLELVDGNENKYYAQFLDFGYKKDDIV